MPDAIAVSASPTTLKNLNLSTELSDTAQPDVLAASTFAALLPQQLAQLTAAAAGGGEPNSLAAGKALPEEAETSATQDPHAPSVEMLDSGAFIWPFAHPAAVLVSGDRAAPQPETVQAAAIPSALTKDAGRADGPATAGLPALVPAAFDQLQNDDALPTVAAGDTPMPTDIAAETAPVSDNLPSADTIMPGSATKADAPAPGTSLFAKEQPVTATVNIPTRDPRWGEAFASRVVWQVGEQIQQAHIQVNPPELGPVEVKVQVQDGQASVQFQTQHAALKETIQDALPRLRDMLAQAGINLADANISQGFAGQGRESSGSQSPVRSPWDEMGELESFEALAVTERAEARAGLIDAYA